ncbi:FAD binding domain-containing protein [Dactylonectria macrodidyma]|uniref:FAD binding domain-containing protein n=1 Tax=Dactylonectria macrodidyma TaxID=307937 RepID=A0A9P9EK36_9HYPO|nr:FAD binding domain-containing protein [Dactylonectria macrodidyma]
MRVLSLFMPIWLSSTAAAASDLLPRELYISNSVKAACAALQESHSDLTLLPSTEEYDKEVVNVWDKRSNLIPACIFRPESSSQVAAAVRIFHENNAQFAVRGGGHLPYPGANSINDGILLVLSGLNEVKVNTKTGTVDVGAGNKWQKVYSTLAPHGLYTIGGRLSSIGVPGVSLLGGVNYFLNKYGFTMDNIVSYDVVLGNGTQVVANKRTNPSLFWALKGSALNYGVVTKFTLKTYKVPTVTSTLQIFRDAAAPAFIKAACDFVLADDASVGSGAVININYNVTTKQATPQVFGLQETTQSPPSRFANFTAIPNPVTRVHNVTTPSEWHARSAAPNQLFRVSFGHHTIKPDAARLTEIYNAWKEAITDVADVPGIRPTFIFNLVPRTAATVAKTNGIGNAFGLDDKQSYIWWQLTTSWARPEDDLRVTTWARNFLEHYHAENNALGLATELLYGGDSADYQNPLLTYPQKNQEKLRRIRDVYDPDLVFTRLNWGGFKLGL